jgi:hypothetical protein
MKFKLKLLQIKCHVLGFTKDKAQNVLQKIIKVFAEVFVSHDRHTLFALDLRVPVGNPALLGLDLPLTAPVGVTGRRRKILTCTQIKKQQEQSLSDYAQQDLSVATEDHKF